MTQQYPPPISRFEVFANPLHAVADLVFIHGPDLVDCSSDPWLSRRVPAEFPNTRILIWRYSSNPLKSFSSLIQQAKDLILNIVNHRSSKSKKDRSLVFVCHSSGGLVLKQALLLAQELDVPDLLSSIRGVIFIESSLKPSESAVGTSSKGILRRTNKEIANSNLERSDSKTQDRSTFVVSDLQAQYQRFKTIQETFQFTTTCFVEEDSTVCDYSLYAEGGRAPSPRSLSIPLQPGCLGTGEPGHNSPGFKLLSAEIKKLVTWRWVFNYPVFVDDFATDLERQSIEGYLSALKIDDGRAKVAVAAPGTLSWVLDHQTYASWQKQRPSSWLWLRGKPGSGKSTLMKYLSSQSSLQLSDLQSVRLSYFFDIIDPSKRGAHNFFRACLFQLVDQITHLRWNQVEVGFLSTEIHRLFSEDWTHDPRAIPRYLQRLLSIIANTHDIVFLIDGLDECETDDAAQIVSFLRHETRSTNLARLRVMVSSRYDLWSEENDALIFVDEENSSDISKFITLQAETCGCKCVKHETAVRRLSGIIHQRASGMFVWVRLALSLLQKAVTRGEDTIALLQALPSDLNGLYERILQQIDFGKHESALLTAPLLTWICAAVRPLSLEEVYGLARINREPKDAEHDIQQKLADFQLEEVEATGFGEELLSQSCGLIQIVSEHELEPSQHLKAKWKSTSKVHFIHSTAFEFLWNGEIGAPDTRRNAPSCRRGLAHLQMAMHSFNSFKLYFLVAGSSTDDGRISRPTFPFVRYASAAWLTHLKAAEQGQVGDEHFQSLVRCLKTSNKSSWRSIQEAFPNTFPDWLLAEPATLMHMASYGGLEKLSHAILSADEHSKEPRACIESVDARGRTPLHIAAEAGSYEVVRLLLDAGAHANVVDPVQGQSALHWAAFHGHEKVTRELINAGANVNEATNGTSPLTQSAAQGHRAVVQILLDAGADPGSVDHRRGQPAISLAILNGHHNVVSLLLQRGASVHTRDAFSNLKPLEHAFISRSPQMVRKLTKHGAMFAPKSISSHSSRLEMWLDRLSKILPQQALGHEPRHQIYGGTSATLDAEATSPQCVSAKTYTSTNKAAKRPTTSREHEDDNEEDDRSPPKRPRIQRSILEQTTGTEKKFACPFYKYDQVMHKDCKKKGFERIDRLKWHLNQRHRIHRCRKCRRQFKDESELSLHADHVMCAPTVDEHTDYSLGYDEVQAKDIGQRDRSQHPEVKWRRIFRVLFPCVPEEDIPRPFVDTLMSTLEEYDEIRLQGLSSMRPELERLTAEGMEPIEAMMRVLSQTGEQDRAVFLQTRDPGGLPMHRGDNMRPDRRAMPVEQNTSATNSFPPIFQQGDRNNGTVARGIDYFNTIAAPPDSGYFTRIENSVAANTTAASESVLGLDEHLGYDFSIEDSDLYGSGENTISDFNIERPHETVAPHQLSLRTNPIRNEALPSVSYDRLNDRGARDGDKPFPPGRWSSCPKPRGS